MAFLLVIAIAAAAAIGRFSPVRRPSPPIATWATMAAVACCLVAQLIRPELLAAFERDAAAIRSGQVYRLFTSLWFQDGGAEGGLFNLAMLFVVGIAAERIWGPRIWSIVYLLGGLGSEVFALRWQPVGAGNSIAYMSLAGAVLASGLLAARPPMVRFAGLIGLAAGFLLALQADVHGIAVLIGAVLGLILALVSDRSRQRMEDRTSSDTA